MTQADGIYLELSVWENLAFFAALFGVDDRDSLRGILDLVDLADRRNTPAYELSGGMRRRLSLACALVHRPEVLFLDEPTVGIDPALRVQFWAYFRRLAAAGTTLLVTSHVMDEADRCDELLLILHGRLLAQGTSAEVMAQAQTLLAAEEQERRRRVVFIVDEAHLLSPEQLEEIRLLTSAEMDSRTPFALLLVGQPTLVRRLKMGVFAALDQRIATRYQLRPMDLAESAQYLRHHLALAGRRDPLFADDAVARLHRASLGLPRALNNLARDALIAAAADGKALVDDACAKRAVAEAVSE